MVGFLLGNTVSANGSVSRGVCVTDAGHNLVAYLQVERLGGRSVDGDEHGASFPSDP